MNSEKGGIQTVRTMHFLVDDRARELVRLDLVRSEYCALLTVHTEWIQGTLCGLAEYVFTDNRTYAVRANFHRCKQDISETDMLNFFRQIEVMSNMQRFRRLSFVIFIAANDAGIWDFDAYETSSDGVWGKLIDELE